MVWFRFSIIIIRSSCSSSSSSSSSSSCSSSSISNTAVVFESYICFNPVDNTKIEKVFCKFWRDFCYSSF